MRIGHAPPPQVSATRGLHVRTLITRPSTHVPARVVTTARLPGGTKFRRKNRTGIADPTARSLSIVDHYRKSHTVDDLLPARGFRVAAVCPGAGVVKRGSPY